MFAIISNGWESLDYSKPFFEEYVKRATKWLQENPDKVNGLAMDDFDNSTFPYNLEEAGYGNWYDRVPADISEEIKAKLLLEMQAESFKELMPGATVFEYDETKVHPVIYDEEYGGQDISFFAGPQKGLSIEHSHVMTYDPTGEHTKWIEENAQTGYDSASDSYTSKVDYDNIDPATIREYTIKGSRQVAEELIAAIPEDQQAIFKKEMNCSGATLTHIRDMLSLAPEQRSVYRDLTGLIGVEEMTPHDRFMNYAKTLSVDAIERIRQIKLHAACSRFVSNIDKCLKVWECLKTDPMMQDFIGGSELASAITSTGDPRLLQYLPLIRKSDPYAKHVIKTAERFIKNAYKAGREEEIKDSLKKIDFNEMKGLIDRGGSKCQVVSVRLEFQNSDDLNKEIFPASDFEELMHTTGIGNLDCVYEIIEGEHLPVNDEMVVRFEIYDKTPVSDFEQALLEGSIDAIDCTYEIMDERSSELAHEQDNLGTEVL